MIASGLASDTTACGRYVTPGTRRRSPSVPRLPRRRARAPQRLEQLALADGIHRLEEAAMLVGHQLADAGQALQRLTLEDRLVVGQVVEHARLEDEEAAVDPSLARLRL